MTAGMILGAVAMMQARWLPASLWIFFAAVVKPLAIVMLLLCGALQPRMRLCARAGADRGLSAAVRGSRLVLSDRTTPIWAMKLSRMAHVMPRDWPFQADFQTMLDSAGIVVPPQVATAVRFAAALGTLAMAWRLRQMPAARARCPSRCCCLRAATSRCSDRATSSHPSWS